MVPSPDASFVKQSGSLASYSHGRDSNEQIQAKINENLKPKLCTVLSSSLVAVVKLLCTVAVTEQVTVQGCQFLGLGCLVDKTQC